MPRPCHRADRRVRPPGCAQAALVHRRGRRPWRTSGARRSVLVKAPLLLQTEGMVTVDAEQLVTLVTLLATSLGVVAYLSRSLTRGLATLGERIDRLEVRIDRLEVRIDKLDARIDKLDARIDGLDSKIDRVEASLREEMRAGFASIDTRFVAMESRFTTLESRLYDLATRVPAAASPPAAS